MTSHESLKKLTKEIIEYLEMANDAIFEMRAVPGNDRDAITIMAMCVSSALNWAQKHEKTLEKASLEGGE